MTKLNFEEHIKDQFSNYNPEVHPRIWENIIAERKNRKPKGFWLPLLNGRNILLLTSLLLAVGTGTWLFFPASVHQKDNKFNPIENTSIGTKSNALHPENAIATGKDITLIK